MLKNYAIKKIALTSIALIILTILYFFPKENETLKIPSVVNYKESLQTVIYLKDKNDYVARTTIINNNTDTIETIKYLITCLTKNSSNEIYIPYSFNPLIPKNTKLIDLSLEEGLLKLNFSKEILNINANEEEKMIEALIYTLTSIKDVKEIMIFVENELLNKLPNSLRQMPTILNKSFGINKVYNINNIKNTSQVTTYYLSRTNEDYYYVPITTVSNNTSEKIEIIIEQLKSKPITKTNLIGFLHANAELEDYEILNDSVNLSFNNFLLDDVKNETILEEVKYAIAYSINDTYGINNINYLINNKKIDELFLP